MSFRRNYFPREPLSKFNEFLGRLLKEDRTALKLSLQHSDHKNDDGDDDDNDLFLRNGSPARVC